MKTVAAGMNGRGNFAISSDYRKRYGGENTGSGTSGILMAIITGILISAGIFITFTVIRLEGSITVLERQAASLQRERSVLEQKRAGLLSRENLERTGKKLGLHPAGPHQIVVLK